MQEVIRVRAVSGCVLERGQIYTPAGVVLAWAWSHSLLEETLIANMIGFGYAYADALCLIAEVQVRHAKGKTSIQ